MKKPLLSIVISSGLNRKQELFRCLRSLPTSANNTVEIIVVHNNREDILYHQTKRSFPSVQLIRLPDNMGIFALNIGYANAKGDYILSLDDDSWVEKGTLPLIISQIKKLPKNIGVLALYTQQDHESIRQYHERVEKEPDFPFNFCTDAIVFNREILRKIGFFDESFIFWFHELDLTVRMINQGYPIKSAKRICVHHSPPRSSFRSQPVLLTFRNMTWFAVKHFSLIYIPLLLARNTITIFGYSIRRRSFRVLALAICGYVWGIVTVFTAIRKRAVLRTSFQRKFLKFYLFNVAEEKSS
jgi:GT2 family glycosyltransferase